MPDIKTHTDYEKANTEYITQLSAAKAARDEVAEVKAENSWMKAQMTMTSDLSTQETVRASRDANIAKLKAEFPQVPEAAYAHIPDVEAMTKVATDIAAVLPAPVADNVGGNGGFTTPSGDQTPPRRQGSPFNDPAEARKIAADARKGNRGAQEMIRKEVFTTMIAPTMVKYGPARAIGRKKAGFVD